MRKALLSILIIACFILVPVTLHVHGQNQDQKDQDQEPRKGGKFRRTENRIKDQYIVVLNDDLLGQAVDAAAHEMSAIHGGADRTHVQIFH